MRNIFKRKRGAALESAILFMLVALMLGMLLTGVIMYTHMRVKLNNTQLTREITIEQIGENFVYMTESEFESSDKYGYTAKTDYEENKKTLTLTLRNKTVLYIEATNDDVEATNNDVITWKYTDKG